LTLELYLKLKSKVESKYPEIVKSTRLMGGKTTQPNKPRIYFNNGSFLDVWLTPDGQLPTAKACGLVPEEEQ